MCNQRERLIDYVYDECDAGERAAVQQHLESCAECRTEIAALRSVRTELQTWEVPEHQSVWQPFAPKPAPAWWSQVPRWAMAAAAGAVLMAGAGGGAASYALLRAEHVTAATAQPTTVDSVTVHDLRELEGRLDARLRTVAAQFNDRIQLATSRQTMSEMAPVLQASLEQQIADLRAKTDEQTAVINILNNNFDQYKKGFNLSHAAMRERVATLTTLLEQGGR